MFGKDPEHAGVVVFHQSPFGSVGAQPVDILAGHALRAPGGQRALKRRGMHAIDHHQPGYEAGIAKCQRIGHRRAPVMPDHRRRRIALPETGDHRTRVPHQVWHGVGGNLLRFPGAAIAALIRGHDMEPVCQQRYQLFESAGIFGEPVQAQQQGGLRISGADRGKGLTVDIQPFPAQRVSHLRLSAAAPAA